MGKGKMTKRNTLKRQYIRTFLLALILSVACSYTALFVFYAVFHRVSGFHSLELQNGKLSDIVQFARQNSEAVIAGRTGGLKELAERVGASYEIRDMENNLLISSAFTAGDTAGRPYLISLLEELRSYSAHSDRLIVPLVDNKTGETRRLLLLTQKEGSGFQLVFLIEIFIPVVVFTLFLLVFSRRFSNRLRRPLGELMEAVKRIKARDLDFSVKALQDDEIGDLAGAFEEMRDNLKSSLLREWQIEQDRRDMVAAITHDLRTPLAIIQGHAEVLQDWIRQDKDNIPECGADEGGAYARLGGEKLDSYLSMILENSQRARKLIDEMNELSEIDGEGFGIQRMETDLPGLVRCKFDEMAVLGGLKGLLTETDLVVSEDVSGTFYVDPGRLSRVFDNIIGNSIRFTPEGGTIRFYARIAGDAATFRVSDTGPGFSEKDLANAFKKFYRGDPSRSMEKGHSGLGLYIAESIVRLHGGTIRAGNNKSGGAFVEFTVLRNGS